MSQSSWRPIYEAFEITLFVPDNKQIIQSVRGAIDAFLQKQRCHLVTYNFAIIQSVCVVDASSFDIQLE